MANQAFGNLQFYERFCTLRQGARGRGTTDCPVYVKEQRRFHLVLHTVKIADSTARLPQLPGASPHGPPIGMGGSYRLPLYGTALRAAAQFGSGAQAAYRFAHPPILTQILHASPRSKGPRDD
ncbi:uncharacterized protein [Dermacentor albipictus]|uniref:uncharacterized protein n=1 Tax=Dermacentor albipictus TaxID=60249 RepID=UPI0038FCBDD7